MHTGPAASSLILYVSALMVSALPKENRAEDHNTNEQIERVHGHAAFLRFSKCCMIALRCLQNRPERCIWRRNKKSGQEQLHLRIPSRRMWVTTYCLPLSELM